MTDQAPLVTVEALFIESVKGRLFALYLSPRAPTKGVFLYLPPFAEEMNRCRALVAAQARAFAQLGYGCLLLDLYGTGDSEGELSDANWETWCRDATAAADWLREQTGYPVILWGCRLGALLALSLADRRPDRYRQLLLWQPTIDGHIYMTQYLRLRVTSLIDRDLPPETTDQIRKHLGSGNIVDVAGYPLSGHLTQSIEAQRIPAFTGIKDVTVQWFENVSEPEAELAPSTRKAVEGLLSQGNIVISYPFVDPPIWQLHKRDWAPNLLAGTTHLYENPNDDCG